MEALRQVWRVLGIIFQGIRSLWNRYWSYRTQAAQRKKLEQNQFEASIPAGESEKPAPPLQVPPLQTASQPKKSPELKPIEIPLIEAEESPANSAALGKWYPPGQGVQIQNILIADGLLYLDQALTSNANNPQTTPGFINPNLPIQPVSIDRRPAIYEADWDNNGALSYETLTPEMRSIYLDWLAMGRKEREIPASALLLFLYGIEHRVLELLQGERTLDELLAIVLELERLDVQYGHYPSIIPKIQGLIECCQVQLALSCQPETLLALLPIGQKLSVALKVALGRCIELGKPIPMSLLWAWYQSSAIAVDLKTPAKRCASAFNFLIQTRGEQQEFAIVTGDHPTMLPVCYQPFGWGMGEDNRLISVVKTIDITGLEPQLSCLEPLIERCTNDLDAYSRLIGRSPETEGTPQAVALLPPELVRLSGNDEVQAFWQWLNETVGSNDWARVTGRELLVHWPTATQDKIRKKEAELLGQLMAKLGFGYAPDVRYGQNTFNPKQAVVLFRLTVPGVEPISDPYPLALTLLELIPFLERTTQAEEPVIQIISSHFELTSSERSRLNALAQWRIDYPLTWKQSLGKTQRLSPDHQERLAIALNAELQKTWQLVDARYIELQAIIPLPARDIPQPELILEQEPIIELEIPARIETKEEDSKVEEQPQPFEEASDPIEKTVPTAEPEPSVFKLDRRLIAQRHQESQVASGLLSDIFDEDEPQPSLPESDNSPTPESIQTATLTLGLDEFHWHLLNHLGQKGSWERSELEAIAQGQGLLLDGALENINEVAFDHCDEALTEGDDPIEVNDWVFDELKAA